ncbi:MAG: 5-oxoprolinase subunit PxpB [Acidobacteria bacterium]|nr:5-oxoprolinase subunit PxpB [Acidobacteriota bacterium]
MSVPRVVAAGDSALVVEFDAHVDPVINDRAISLSDAIRSAGIGGIRDVVPTYRSVAVYFDPLRTDYDALVKRVEREASTPSIQPGTARALLRIPVCYGGDFGPDLAGVAAFARLSEQEVVGLHGASTYRVFMLGFVPGFAYMGVVDSRIAMPRRATPRVRVPLGSVGIAGAQTGIYPAETPGGWQVIGRTPIKPFDPQRVEPFLLQAGDAVRFDAISREEFDQWPSA